MNSTVTTQRSAWRERLPVRAVAALVIAVAVNVGIVALASSAGVAPDFRALTVPPVAFLSVVGVVGAAGVYLLVRRRSATPDRTFRRVAVGALVVSFLPDLGLLVGDPAATPAGVAVLMAMHVVVAAACLWLIPEGER